MRKTAILIMILIAVLAFSTCAPGPNNNEDTSDRKGEVAGFWMGLWHGFIALVTFIISLFSDKVNVYEVHNSGGWYNFGFILGVMMAFGGGKGASSQARKGRKTGSCSD